MPRKSKFFVQDLPDIVDEDGDDSDENVDIAFIPGDDSSSDENSDFDCEDLSSTTRLPNGFYEQVKSSYNSTQKLLESKHLYNFKNGAQELPIDSADDFTFDLSMLHNLKSKNAFELFHLFFTDDMKNHIIEATRENHFQLSKENFDKFLTIIMITIFNVRKSQRDYWSKKLILGCPIVQKIMTRNNFCEIKKHLRFYKNADRNDLDKVWKVRKLYEIFRCNISRFGFIDYNLSIDEMMVKYFGRFGIKQCIRNKPIRFGMKLWALCSSDGYLYDLEIYQGKGGVNEGPLKSICLGSRVVLRMLQKLLESCSTDDLQKYHVYFDNFFTNPDLMIHLEKIGLLATGTVRQNRVKQKVEMPKNASRGTTIAVNDQNSKLNYITVMDSKPVSILSTKYGNEPKAQMQRCHNKKKQTFSFPQAFLKYNKNMGGVDLHDQHCNALSPSIKSKKWTWPLFCRLIQSAITNATVIHNKLHPDNKKGTKSMVEEICQYYVDSFSDNQRQKRQKVETSPQKSHKRKIGIFKKCDVENCNTKTERLCVKCKIHLCKYHDARHDK